MADYLRLDRAMAIRKAEYDYVLPSLQDEALTLGTWITASDGKLTMERRFQIVRNSDQGHHPCAAAGTWSASRWAAASHGACRRSSARSSTGTGSLRKRLGVVRQVVFHEGLDEVIAMVVTRLAAQREGWPTCAQAASNTSGSSWFSSKNLSARPWSIRMPPGYGGVACAPSMHWHRVQARCSRPPPGSRQKPFPPGALAGAAMGAKAETL